MENVSAGAGRVDGERINGERTETGEHGPSEGTEYNQGWSHGYVAGRADGLAEGRAQGLAEARAEQPEGRAQREQRRKELFRMDAMRAWREERDAGREPGGPIGALRDALQPVVPLVYEAGSEWLAGDWPDCDEQTYWLGQAAQRLWMTAYMVVGDRPEWALMEKMTTAERQVLTAYVICDSGRVYRRK
jgi:hypothetical protein